MHNFNLVDFWYIKINNNNDLVKLIMYNFNQVDFWYNKNK